MDKTCFCFTWQILEAPFFTFPIILLNMTFVALLVRCALSLPAEYTYTHTLPLSLSRSPRLAIHIAIIDTEWIHK